PSGRSRPWGAWRYWSNPAGSVAAAAERAPWQGAGMLPGLDHVRAVHEDVLDPVREPARLVVRGVRPHCRRIEHHEIRDETVRDATAIPEPEARRRHGGH